MLSADKRDMSHTTQIHYFVYPIFLYLTTIAGVVIMQNIRQRYFAAVDSVAMTVNDRAYYTVERISASRITCAVSCELDEKCVFFEYIKETELCRLATDKSGTHLVYYKYARFCPSDKGYILWVYDDMTLCVKYDARKMNHTESKALCQQDGGHHFLIESEEMRQHVKELLDEMGAAGIAFFDGFDVFGNDVFLSWKGIPLPWVRWMGNNPHHGEQNCIEGSSAEGYAFRDFFCSAEYFVVCQIDM